MTQEPTPLVTVLPCDQRVASAIYQHFGFNGGANFDVSNRVLQLAARHRLAALEAAAKVAEDHIPIGDTGREAGYSALTGEAIATAIRALSNKGGEAFSRPTDPNDAEWAFWLNDAASILQSNGTETHADWVRRAAERFAHPTPGDSPCK